MGILRFASRMQACGLTTIIGSKSGRLVTDDSTSEAKFAVIDGPSLAHSLFNSNKVAERSNIGIATDYSYAALGKAAVDWLDQLQSHGFQIAGIYFDGELPPYKKNTRINRMRRSIEKLVDFKQVHDDVEQRTRTTDSGVRSDWSLRRLSVARKDVAAPPFLVFAVIEALLRSQYANLTWVVPGEADAYCVAAARSINVGGNCRPVYIFTNDSDLLIYECGMPTKIAMIDSIVERDDGPATVMEAQVFWPWDLAQKAPVPSNDLIQPAYLMLRPDVAFRAALAESQISLTTAEYKEFASQYDLSIPMARLPELKRRRISNIDDAWLDSRISELIQSAIHEGLRISRAKTFRSKRDQESEAKDDNDIQDQRITPNELDMYLPILFEDPSRASAWKIGSQFRGAAVYMLLMSRDLDTTVLEYRRSGHLLFEHRLQRSFGNFFEPRFKAWTLFISREVALETHLDAERWRFLVVQFMITDMVHENITLPTVDQIVNLLLCKPAETWNIVHLQAQFEAEYYSVRMLKQVLIHMRKARATSPWVRDLHERLQGLPWIADFFDMPSEQPRVGALRWKVLIQEYLSKMDIKEAEVLQPVKLNKGGSRVATSQHVRSGGNRFQVLAEEEEE